MIRIINEKYLSEMAIVNPRKCKQLSIQVEIEQRDEGPIPHLHCFLDKSRNPRNCSYIRLDTNEYAPHHKGMRLGKSKKEFIELMTSHSNDYIKNTRGEIVPLTGYQSAVKIWVETFEDGSYEKFTLDENGIPVMPDYSKL